MTTITNKYGFPDPLYQAAKNSAYSPGDSDISVTTLIDAPRPAVLALQHAGNFTVDVADLMYSLMGQGVHTLLERSGVTGVVEERLYADVNGWRVGGQFDYIDDDGMLWDWKTVSVYEVMNGIKDSREQQLNCYAYLAKKNGYTINGLRVGFVFRDWRKGESRQANYPPHPALIYPIKMWSDEEVEGYIVERVRIHQEAREVLPECTDDEQWRRGDKWAVYRSEDFTGRASKLFDNRNDAYLYANSISGRVEHRRGLPTRCLNYCNVSTVCEQFQREQRGNSNVDSLSDSESVEL